mgnify:CR=1 FL=1
MSRISEEEGIIHFEPVPQIDPRSLAPFQLTKFDSLRLHQALVNTSESSDEQAFQSLPSGREGFNLVLSLHSLSEGNISLLR